MSGRMIRGAGLRRALVVTVALAALGVAQAEAASVACFAPADAKQAYLRQLQQDFTVAALSCGAMPAESQTMSDRYNAFVGKFANALRDNAHLLLAHFGNHGGTSGFDSWMTKLANAASVRAATDPGYCQRAWTSLELAMVVEPTQIADFAVLNTEQSELVPVCHEHRVAKPAHKPSDVVGMIIPARDVAGE